MSDLFSEIYHERQEGQLCAQHCLNNLLQGSYFTPLDLAAIGRELDEEELLINPTKGAESTNYDDTGFFSLTVIERALQVWDIALIPFNSTDQIAVNARMHPENCDAFVLNLAEHWLTLRRFGGSTARWYNLNSVTTKISHISTTYLELLLRQMISENYAVFIVTGSLPFTQADELAALCPMPSTEALKVPRSTKGFYSADDKELERVIRESEQDGDEGAMAKAIEQSLKDSEVTSDFILSKGISQSVRAEGSNQQIKSIQIKVMPLLDKEEVRKKRLERFN